jgi:hypothetical protein
MLRCAPKGMKIYDNSCNVSLSGFHSIRVLIPEKMFIVKRYTGKTWVLCLRM